MTKLFVLSTYTSKFLTGWLAWIGAGVGLAIGFVFGSVVLFYILLSLMAVDLITGICASLVRDEEVCSAKLQSTTYKLLAYSSILLVCACLGLVFPPLMFAHYLAIGWCIASEAVSTLENTEVVLGRRLPFLGRIKRVLKALKMNGDNQDDKHTNSVTDTVEQDHNTKAASPKSDTW